MFWSNSGEILQNIFQTALQADTKHGKIWKNLENNLLDLGRFGANPATLQLGHDLAGSLAGDAGRSPIGSVSAMWTTSGSFGRRRGRALSRTLSRTRPVGERFLLGRMQETNDAGSQSAHCPIWITVVSAGGSSLCEAGVRRTPARPALTLKTHVLSVEQVLVSVRFLRGRHSHL